MGLSVCMGMGIFHIHMSLSAANGGIVWQYTLIKGRVPLGTHIDKIFVMFSIMNTFLVMAVLWKDGN